MTGKRQSSFYDLDSDTFNYPHVDDAKHDIVIYWRNGDTIQKWNEHMAWVTEQFGLPGVNWTADVKSEGMIIRFINKHDAMMARLKFGL